MGRGEKEAVRDSPLTDYGGRKRVGHRAKKEGEYHKTEQQEIPENNG